MRMTIAPGARPPMMRVMNIALAQRMTVDEFLVWSQRQDKGRYELQDGVVIMQQSQNIAHLKTKARVYTALLTAIEKAGVGYYALPDGATVRVGPRTAFEPDALVAPLPMPADDELAVADPVVVVEVLSPSSARSLRQSERLFPGAKHRTLSGGRSSRERIDMASPPGGWRIRTACGFEGRRLGARPAYSFIGYNRDILVNYRLYWSRQSKWQMKPI